MKRHFLIKTTLLLLILALVAGFNISRRKKGHPFNSTLRRQLQIDSARKANKSSENPPKTYFPLTLRSVVDYEQNFLLFYKYNVNNNVGSEDYKIPWTLFRSYFDIENSGGGTTNGILFSYIEKDPGSSSPHFSYLITGAQRTSTVQPKGIYKSIMPGTPMPPITEEYIYADNPNSYLAISNSHTFNLLRDAYQNLSVTKFDDNFIDPIIDITNHPLQCFYYLDAFKQLKNDNTFSGQDDPSKFTVVIKHGAIYMYGVGLPGSNRKVQMPIIYLEYDGHILLDDVIEDQPTFKNKALDIGVLCPPDCNY